MPGEIIDDRFPWILFDRGTLTITDSRDGSSAPAPTAEAQWAFIADHSAATPGKGLGDRIHQALDWAGFRRCVPCAQRQAMLNAIGQVTGS
jgi:hypothetical protein